MHRAYAIAHVKSVDGDQRVIRGIATTPEPDRVGDIVEPLGVKFKNPLPLLLHHDSRLPVGQVQFSKATAKGIEFEARLADPGDSATLKDRIEEAWASVRAGLIKGVSIGFRTLENGYEALKTGGIRYTKTEVLELSLVAVPANASATITSIKSADAPHLALLGARSRTAPTSPAVVGLLSKDRSTKMNYSERLSVAQGELTEKTVALEALMALEALNEEQTADRDSLTSEVDRLTATVKSLSVLQRVSEAKADPIAPRTAAPVAGQKHFGGQVTVDEPKLEPGIAYARMALCLLAAQNSTMKGNPLSPMQVAKQWYPSSDRTQLAVKTAVAPAVTTDTAWAGSLVYSETIADFVNFLRPQTIVGQFGTNGIPSLHRVPFNMREVTETSGMTGYWVGQAKPKNVTKGALSSQTLGFAKVAAIAVAADELLKFANHPSVSAESYMRDSLTSALVSKIDTSFIDPSFAAVSNVNPASITNGLSLGSSAGNTVADVKTDILSLYASIGVTGLGTTKNLDPRGVVLIMPPGVALALSLMETDLGNPAFPGITINGGKLQGIPVIVSNYAALAGYGNLVVAVAAPEINLADDGQVSVDMSREASLELNDSPTQSGTTGVSLVSLWQDNLVAFRAERYITWGLRRSGVVAAMQSVNWGGVGSPV